MYIKKKEWDIDKIFMFVSLLYIVLPVCLFFCGWIRFGYALCFVCLSVIAFYLMFHRLTDVSVNIENIMSVKHWAFLLIVLFVWLYFSGMCQTAYQNDDLWARNAVYRDLCDYNWPVVYDLSKQSGLMQQISGSSGNVLLSYYFTWWLVPAFLTKCFGLGNFSRNLILFIYAFIGLLCVFYNLFRYFKKVSYSAILIFVFFGGMDILGYLLINGSFPQLFSHIEWWAGYFQLSSNTTLLFWVFNQAVPVWIIMLLFLQCERYSGVFLTACCFAYSPWAFIGLLPILCVRFFGKESEGDGWLQSLDTRSVLLFFSGLILCFAYGMFYLSGTGVHGESYFIFNNTSHFWIIFSRLVLFLVFEVLAYYVIMHKRVFLYRYSVIALLEFCAFPLFVVVQYSWVIRGLIPAGFLLMIFCIRFLSEQDKGLLSYKRCLFVILVLGSLASAFEIGRSVDVTATNGIVLNDDVYSLGNVGIKDESIMNLIENQFYSHEYEGSFFGKYLLRR